MRLPRPEDETLTYTSLIDISFLLLVFFMAQPFKGLDFKLQSQLPRGEGINPWEAPHKETVKIRVRPRGDEVLYALGDRAAASAEDLRPWIEALGPAYAYEIDASADVPWQGVVDAVNVLAATACTDVRFRGGPPPSRDIRRRLH